MQFILIYGIDFIVLTPEVLKSPAVWKTVCVPWHQHSWNTVGIAVFFPSGLA